MDKSNTSSSFLSPQKEASQLCIICNDVFKKKDIIQEVIDALAFKSLALSWSKLDIPTTLKEHCYLSTINRVKTCEVKNERIVVHKNCRTRFKAYLKRFSDTYKEKQETVVEDETNIVGTETLTTRSQTQSIASLKKQCFVCNVKRKSDEEPYNMGGLRRCDSEDTAIKIIDRKKLLICMENHKLYPAAKRLDVLLSGFYDIFAADVYIHQSCYLKFAINPIQPKAIDAENSQRKDDVLSEFKFKIRTKIIRNQEAFLLHELLNDVTLISNEQGLELEDSPIRETRTLRRFLESNFENEVSFYSLGKYIVVCPSDVNPCIYSIATLKGRGLRDLDLVKSFGRMIRRKIEEKKKKENKWPLTQDELLAQMDEGPLQEIYNAIYFSKYEHGTVNEYGFASTSEIQATKIWSIASDFESFVCGKKSPKQIMLGLYLHRLTGNKEVISALHKYNHTISYDDICIQNSAWANMITSQKGYYPSFRKCVVTHSTLDNNDGRQETMTGSGTTHDTNKTLFQLPSKKEILDIPCIGHSIQPLELCEEIVDVPSKPAPYEVGTRVGPPLLVDFQLRNESNEIDASFERDIAWSLAGLLEGEEYPLLGSWTPFNKMVTDFDTSPCVQEYLPVTPHPPEYPVCKEYLDFLLEIIEELEIPYIFVHSDEMVYSKLCDIIWKDSKLYSQIILLMGGFHELRVMQRLIYKRHQIKGYRQWCVDANTIASGSADQAFEGRHYFRSMRVHKECFDALVQFRIEKLKNGVHNINEDLLEKVKLLRKDPSPTSLNRVIHSTYFKELVKSIVSCSEKTDGAMTVAYLKDVSLILSLVSAVREANIEKHLQAEQKMIYLTFAYDHQNYARYSTYQNCYLNWLKQKNHSAIKDLTEKGIGGSLSGDPFSTIHGDLITELFNKETKGTGGPFRAGFSTNSEAVNKWVHTIHIHAVLRKALRTSLHMKSSSKHKEVTNRGKSVHREHVKNLKEILLGYGTDPFSNDSPRCISTGREIAKDVVNDMFLAPTLGETKFNEFVRQRLVNKTVGFFAPISKNKLKTGIVKEKRKPKALTVLKEDCQAFGLIISKSISITEAFSHCITSIPLSLATPEGELRQSDKASFRNFLINESKCTENIVPKNAAWYVDGLSAIRTLKPKETFEEWITLLFKFISPPAISEATCFGMINDTYPDYSTKAGTRKKRGEGSRVYVKGIKQHMPQGFKWQEFLGNNANKEELIELIFKRFQELSKGIKKTIVFSRKDETYNIARGKIELIHRSNHEEADSRLVLQAFINQGDSVIVCKDTDVLILMIWAYAFYKIEHKWFFKYDNDKYADVRKLCEHFGVELCLSLPAFHGLTGCDTTSYFYRSGKVRIFKKMISDTNRCSMLQPLGKDKDLNKSEIELIMRFIQTVVYSGKDDEDYIATRVRIYKSLKSKSSMSLPPDPDSVTQAIKRVHFQVYYWIRCCTPMIESIPLEKNGWIITTEDSDVNVRPCWFTGSQLPPSLLQKKKKNKKEVKSTADDELSDGELYQPQRKKAKKKKNIKGNVEAFYRLVDNENDADEESEGLDGMNNHSSDDWEDWENWEDFLPSDNDSADEWLP